MTAAPHSEAQTGARLDAPSRQATNAERRIDELRTPPLRALEASSDLAQCLPVFLVAVGWQGTSRELYEALPDRERFGLTDLQNVLANLGYVTRNRRVESGTATERPVPFIVVPEAEPACVVLGRESDQWVVFRAGDEALSRVPLTAIEGQLIELSRIVHEDLLSGDGWFGTQIRSVRGLLWQAFTLTAISNVLALAVPLYIMSIYDRVIPGHSVRSLISLGTGALLALVLDVWIRNWRSRSLAYAGARLSYVVGSGVFKRLISLPSALTERASVAAQVAHWAAR